MTHMLWIIQWQKWYRLVVHRLIRKTCSDPKSVSIIFRPINRKISWARGKRFGHRFKSPTYYRFIDLSPELYGFTLGNRRSPRPGRPWQGPLVTSWGQNIYRLGVYKQLLLFLSIFRKSEFKAESTLLIEIFLLVSSRALNSSYRIMYSLYGKV